VEITPETELLMIGGDTTRNRAPDDGWRYHPKHVEQFIENKLYIVASRWIITGIPYTIFI
jgi:hypothetical protein